MGVNLSGLTEPRTLELSELSGKRVALDSYNIIYQFLSSIRQPDGKPLCDSSGRTTSNLTGLLHRTANLVEAGIEPVFVFDGKPTAGNPAFVRLEPDSFCYAVKCCHPIVWACYRAEDAGGKSFPLEISTDGGRRCRSLPSPA